MEVPTMRKTMEQRHKDTKEYGNNSLAEIHMSPCFGCQRLKKTSPALAAEESSSRNTLKSASTADKQTKEPNAGPKN